MARILILYSTTDGHTLKICRRLQDLLRDDSHHVMVTALDDAGPVALEAFDKVVIGASIRYGKHNPVVTDFISRRQTSLESRPNAFFSVSAVARKPGRDQPDTNPYLRKFLKNITWRPKRLAVFAGKIDYPKYGAVDRTIIRLIMWITKGPTDPTSVVEFTDWERVAAFAREISEM